MKRYPGNHKPRMNNAQIRIKVLSPEPLVEDNFNEEYDSSNSFEEDSEIAEGNQFVERFSEIDDDDIDYYERMFEKQARRRFIVRQKRGNITHKTNNGYRPPVQTESIDTNDEYCDDYYGDDYYDDEFFEEEEYEDNFREDDYEDFIIDECEYELLKRYPNIFHLRIGKYISKKEEELDYSIIFQDFNSLFFKKPKVRGPKKPFGNKRIKKDFNDQLF
jgi:hypothetical protein